MRPLDLLKACKQQSEMGLDRIVLVKPMPKSWNHGNFRSGTMTPFGMAKVLGSTRTGDLMFCIEISKVLKYLERVLKSGEEQG